MLDVNYDIVVPCFNCEDTINECLEAAIKQSFKPKKIICVNNNSTDQTYSILQEFAKKYDFVEVYNEEKKGASYARNTGANYVNSDYIQFLDADDIILPTKIESQINLIQNINELPLILEGYVINGNAHHVERDVWVGLIMGKLGYTVSNLWPVEAFKKVGGFDVKLKTSEEYDLLFRLLQSCETICSSHLNTIKQEVNPTALTKINESDNWERFIDLRVRVIHYLEHQNSIANKHYEAFFFCLRSCYKFNSKYAVHVYKKHKANLRIQDFNLTNGYKLMVKIWGFSLAEKLIRKINKIE